MGDIPNCPECGRTTYDCVCPRACTECGAVDEAIELGYALCFDCACAKEG